MKKTIDKFEMPLMITGRPLEDRLAVYPEYESSIRTAPVEERLVALQSLYEVYIPNRMSRDIYTKMYLALVRSLGKKKSLDAVRQSNTNNMIIRGKASGNGGIIGGSDSMTIIGESGIGKSSTVNRVVSILSDTEKIIINGAEVIPCLLVQAPADSSVKGLLMEILRKADELLGSSYYFNAQRAKATVDILIGTVSQICLLHIGILVIDEIQNVVSSKNGASIVGTLTQLINNSGISIAMVGTQNALRFFESDFMLARRSLGLKYGKPEYGEEFKCICRCLLQYQYVKATTEPNEAMFQWLYNHSGGNISVVVALVHDAQEIAIVEEYERLDIHSLSVAYERRLTMLHGFIDTATRIENTKKHVAKKMPEKEEMRNPAEFIYALMQEAKAKGEKTISVLNQNGINVEEITI